MQVHVEKFLCILLLSRLYNMILTTFSGAVRKVIQKKLIDFLSKKTHRFADKINRAIETYWQESMKEEEPSPTPPIQSPPTSPRAPVESSEVPKESPKEEKKSSPAWMKKWSSKKEVKE